MQIYISKNGTQNGPYSPKQVQQLLTSGYVTTNDLSWRHGFSEWQPLYMVLGLLPPVAPPPPSPPRGAPVRVRKVKLDQPEERIPVGGLLYVYGLWHIVVTPIGGLCAMNYVWEIFQPFMAMYPALRHALTLENIVGTIFVFYGVAVGFAICSGDLRARKITKGYLLVTLLAEIAMQFGMVYATFNLPDQISGLFVVNTVFGIPSSLVCFAIWWLYFTKSIRVQMTYGW